MKKRIITKFKIKDKTGKRISFSPNRAQRDYMSKRTGKDFILKARQLGFTTFEQLRKLEKALARKYVNVATIAHDRKKTNDIFQIAKFAWDSLDEDIRELYSVKYDNVRELSFSANGSKYFVDLNLRSGTVQDLHISELAFVRDVNGLFASSLEAVPKGGSITIETTANGLNKAHEIWQEAQEGKNEFTPHFYNWTWDDGYWETPPSEDSWKNDYKLLAKRYSLVSDIQSRFQLSDSQFYWYYLKTRRLKDIVKQEYPIVPEEAFLSSAISVFDLFTVANLKPTTPIRSVKGVSIYREPKSRGEYIIGCDTSEGGGNDKTAIRIIDVTSDVYEEVAGMSSNNIRPDQAADLMIELGRLYNNAFLIPERNGSGLTTVLRLQEKGARNMFVNKAIDKKTKKPKNEYGWRTTSTNRDMMIDDFVEIFEEDRMTVHSSEVIQEMKTFVTKANGKREHDEGYDDDNLFAFFLAVQGRKYNKALRVFPKKSAGF